MSHKPIIVHVVAEPELGLATRMLALLATDAAALHKVAFLTSAGDTAAFFSARGVHGFHRGRDGGTFLPFSFVATRWLHELARRTHAEILHAHDARAASIADAVAKRLQLPLVRTECDPDADRELFRRGPLRRMRFCVATSEHVRQRLLRAVPLLAPKMMLIPAAVELPPLDDVAPSRSTQPLRVHVLHGADTQATRTAIDGVPGVISVAAAESLRESVCNADVVVAPPVHETGHDGAVELAVLEAMALGRPVVVPRLGSLPELVEHDGRVFGRVARDARPASLAQALEDLLLELPLANPGAAARAHVERVHSAESLRAGYRALYARLTPRER